MAKKKSQLHSLIKKDIIEKMESGYYRPGRLLPTETEFCSLYEVSRTTIRTALNHLIMEGYIYRKQGKGTFVAKGKVQQTLSSSTMRFSDQLRAQSRTPRIKVEECREDAADKKAAQKLGINEGDPIYIVKRTRFADDEEIQFEIAYVRKDLVPDLTKESAARSLYDTITANGHQLNRTEEQIKIVITDEEAAASLNISTGAPCFQISTITFIPSEEAVEYSEAYFRGDRVEFMIERNYQ
ncbi:GntR family transcriptional regulator [Salibacterium halotolerans]|uniref:GntR family transcriptional regulator n=1 Tax=Salibacterium halotolerans TaxID=1884432 RepID=A0A1I5V545_9BACI|nr:GntR family transcriptional regulator [Salibacterium halotolerans]SFQ02615.1 GntR family transcriptional regulator [Salibacterium halotolerans]